MIFRPGHRYLTRFFILCFLSLGILLLALGCLGIFSLHTLAAFVNYCVVLIVPAFSKTGHIRDPHTFEAVSTELLRLRWYVLPLGAAACSFAWLWNGLLREKREPQRAAEETPVEAPKNRQRTPAGYTIALAALVLIGAYLRAIKLPQSFWHDEIAIFEVFLNPFGFWRYFPTGLGDHRLCTLISLPLFRIFGAHETIIRLPFFLLGVAAIPLLYRFAKDFFSAQEALGASLILTFAGYHVLYSDQARGYVGMVFFVLVSSLLLFRILLDPRQPPPKKYVFLFGATAALGVYNHFFYLIPLGMQFIFLCSIILFRRLTKRPVVAAGGITLSDSLTALLCGILAAFLLYGPLVFKALFNQILNTQFTNKGIPLLSLGHLGMIATNSPGGEYAYLYALLFSIGLIHLFARGRILTGYYFLAMVVLPLALMRATLRYVDVRYCIFILPFLVIGAVHGSSVISKVSRERMRPLIFISLLALLFTLQLPGLIGYLNHPCEQDFKNCARTIERLARENDTIYCLSIAPESSRIFTSRFYIRKYPVKTEVSEKEFFDRVHERKGVIWVMILWPEATFLGIEPENRAIMKYIRDHFVQAGDFGPTVFLYRLGYNQIP